MSAGSRSEVYRTRTNMPIKIRYGFSLSAGVGRRFVLVCGAFAFNVEVMIARSRACARRGFCLRGINAIGG